jgi:dihydropyrimidine dehydrogenase (NAD+) subunit PreA
MVTEWVKEVARTPVLVKLTPNIADIRYVGRAAREGGADGLSLINTINSVIGVDLNTLRPKPHVDGRGSHGGYCGPAVKPIALNMVQQLAADSEIGIPISGIGGVQAWQDAVEFMLLGASNVQVCTAAMHYGFRIVEHMISGLESWMREKRYSSITDFIGKSVPAIGDWAELNLGYKVVAEINKDLCIHCGLCYIACEDGAHQSIERTVVSDLDFVAELENADVNGRPKKLAAHSIKVSGGKKVVAGMGGGYVNRYDIRQDTCVGCNLCSLVCPVSGCIEMVERDSGIADMTWREYQDKLARGAVEKIQPPRHV